MPPPNQRLSLRHAYDVVPLENLPGLLALSRHYTQVVMPLQPPVVDRRLSQVLKGEALAAGGSGPRTRRRRRRRLLFGDRL
jgi:hypothetical protein